MLLSATGAGRKEIFLGPPYKPDTQDADPHDHKVGTLNIWITRCQNDWMSELLDVRVTGCQDVRMSGCQDVWMSECLDVRMSGCQDVRMTG